MKNQKNVANPLWSHRRFLFIITVIALVVRALWFVSYTRHEQNYEIAIDSKQYHEIAAQIVNSKGITTPDNKPNFFRLPGYPVMLAGLYAIVGTEPLPAMMLQVMLTSLLPILLFLLSLVLFPHNMLAAQIAATVAALHPGFIFFAGVQSSESLFLIFFILFLIFFFRGITTGKAKEFCLAGVLLGISSLIRAVGHYVVFLAVILIFVHAGRLWGKKIQQGCVLLSSWLLVVAVWVARNYMLTGYIFLHTLTGQHFLRYNVVYNIMDTENISYSQAKHIAFAQRDARVTAQERELGRPLSEPEIDKLTGTLAFQCMLQHPFLTMKYACSEMFKLCKALYSCNVWQVPAGVMWQPDTPLSYKISMYLVTFKTYPIIIPFIIWDWFFTLMMLIGMLQYAVLSYYHRRVWNVFKMLAPFIIVLVGITCSTGLIRLRLPVEPFFIMMAAYGWANMLQARAAGERFPLFKHTHY